jgi:tungstate transport system ATP-binding protein
VRRVAGGFTLEIRRCQIKTGELTLVTGGNGAGKTLFFRLLAFLDFPDSGDIIFGGFRTGPVGLRRLMGLRRRVSCQMQSPYLFNAGVYQNVAYGLSIRGFNRMKIKGLVHKILEELGIAHLRGRHTRELSGGEAQRVALARAMVIPAAVYLFDEPTANVDREFVPVVERAIVQLQRRQKATVVMTSHSTRQALSLGGNLVTVAGGKVVSDMEAEDEVLGINKNQ